MAQDSYFAPTALCPPLPDGRRVSGVASPSRDALPARAFEGLPYLVSSVGIAVIRLSTIKTTRAVVAIATPTATLLEISIKFNGVFSG
jgi:hypothetical protein